LKIKGKVKLKEGPKDFTASGELKEKGTRFPLHHAGESPHPEI
jgi:hypothetical protein